MVVSVFRKLFGLGSRQRPVRCSRYSPRLDALEDRALPSATLLANDNWVVENDVDHSSTLTAGDIVNNSADTGAIAVSGTFGVDAFSTINDAVEAAAAGDTVKVLEGTYTETVIVDESISLLGPNAGISAGTHAGTRVGEAILDGGIMVDADNVTIDGLTILNGADFVGETVGIYLAEGASEITIQNNILTGDDAGRGILSTFNGDNDNLKIQNNDIGGWSTGIFNQSNVNVDVLNNVIHDNVAGVSNDYVQDLLIQGNTFTANDEAIGTFESTDVEVHYNNLAENLVAIRNYGGETIDASSSYFGTTDEGEIDDLVVGEVDFSDPLTSELTDTTHVFTAGGVTFIVDTQTGEFTLNLADGTSITGSGARLQNGVLKIHEQTSAGKLDVTASLDDGEITLNLRGKNKQSFKLNSVV